MVEFSLEYSNIYKEWHDVSNYICLLSCNSLNCLNELLEKLKQNNIKHSCFYEPDLNNMLTAIAIEPGIKTKKLLSNIPLAFKVQNVIG